MKKKQFKNIVSFCLVLILLSSTILTVFADESYRVLGNSMYPTIRDGEILDIISKDYKENDIVVADVDGKSIVKRVKGDKLIGDNEKISDIYNLSMANVIGKASLSKNQSNNEDFKIAKASSNIPELTAYQKDNHAKLEWAVEMKNEDVLTLTSFESGQELPSGMGAGGQSITTEDKYSGQRSVKIFDTYNNGNWYQFPQTSSINSIMTFSRKYFPNGTNLSISFKAKSDTGGTLMPNGDGGWGNKIVYLTPKYARSSIAGSTILYLDSMTDMYLGRHIMFDTNDDIIGGYYQVREMDTTAKTITLNSGIPRAVSAGEKVVTRTWRGAWSFNSRYIPANNEWTSFSINTQVSNYDDYDVAKRGGTFYIGSSTPGKVYIDDIKFGYATKSQLYRENTMIYEGYLSDFEDTLATDKAKPNAVSNITLSSDKNILKVNYSKPGDNGTNYNYKIRGKSDNSETPFSNIKPVTVTSGIKGYSYVIDTNPNTVPNNTVNTTSTEITKAITEGKTYYLHIKAIDNAGNASDVVHKQINVPHLTATPVPAEDYIQLDWNVQDKGQSYNYMIYQKKQEDSEFQTIPLKDNIKVLEVYPYASVVKEWTNNYGLGKIETHSITSEAFNLNPEQVWNYDVVVLGFADSNNGKTLSDNARLQIDEFVERGHGLLLGHDTIYVDNGRTNYRLLATKYLNMESHPTGNWYNGADRTDTSGGGISNIIISKKGFLTNYPHKIGEVGDKLKIPYSHTSYQFAKGDIWMRFDNPNQTDPYNFYLTTWNNVAMLQTGHSIRKDNATGEWATEDEQKLLVNTLFYLSQTTNATSWKDRTGQDVSAPNKPNIQSVSTKDNNSKIEIKYNAVEDNGTDYEYFVEATGANDNVKINSNIANATIKSGLKGYSIVVDNNPNTTPDNVIETTATTFILNEQRTSDFYVHVASVDKVGNISEVSHYHYKDTTKPTLTITHTPTTWTADYVDLHAVATDNGVGVQRIRLPNNNWVNGSSVNYRVISNGNYEFVARDFFGNETTNSIIITNIDKTAPTNPSITHNLDWTNASQVPVTISSGTDTQSGVNRTEYSLSGATTLGWTTYSGVINITNEGVTKVTARTIDNLGHISDITTSNVRIDRTLPHATSIIINSNAVFSNSRNVTLTLSAMDSASGVDKMQFKNEDGSWSTEEDYKTSKAWILSSTDGTKTVWVRYKDLAGNWSTPVKDTIELDMTAPVITKFTIQDDREYYNNHSVHLNLKVDDNLSGIKEVYISNDNVSFTKKPYAEKISWTLSSGEGIKTVYMKALDNSGNMTSTVSDTITIDTIKPTGSIVINNENAQTMSRDVSLNLIFSDNLGGSGIDIVKVVENDNEFMFPSVPSSPKMVDWRLDEGTGLKTVHLVLIDKAGNISDTISDSIIVDKLSIERFTLTDVVNPILFNKNNSFISKEWTFEPQDMLSGANISFALDLKKAHDASVVKDSVIYKVEIIGSGYHKALTGDMLHQGGDNYSKTITLPEDAPKGSKVYVIATATRDLLVSPFDIQIEYFPGVEATTKAQIGIIEGNIYEAIRFNETN